LVAIVDFFAQQAHIFLTVEGAGMSSFSFFIRIEVEYVTK